MGGWSGLAQSVEFQFPVHIITAHPADQEKQNKKKNNNNKKESN